MASSMHTNHEETSKKTNKNLDNWKFPNIPINQIYKKKASRIFPSRTSPSYAIKDFQETIALKPTNQDVSFKLITKEFLQQFVKNQYLFLHLGLVQVSIKPLMRDGLGGSIIVCVTDSRLVYFEDSILAMVELDLSKGPFYFNCFPSFTLPLNDASIFNVLTLNVKSSGVPLALTYRVVCKAKGYTSSEALQVPTLGETVYFQANSGGPNTTKWDEIEVPESWTRREEPAQVTRKKNPSFRTVTLPDGRVMVRMGSTAGDEDD